MSDLIKAMELVSYDSPTIDASYGTISSISGDIAQVTIKPDVTIPARIACSCVANDRVLMIKKQANFVVIANLTNPTTKNSITLNGTLTPNPSFYAPLGSGTDGQVLRSTGGVPAWEDNWELLWTNTSPSSTFAAQTVSLTGSLASYDFIAVSFSSVSNGSSFYNGGVAIFRKEIGNTSTYMAFRSGEQWIASRHIGQPSNTTISFSIGQFWYQSYSSYGEGNQYAVPLKIYGIKAGS